MYPPMLMRSGIKVNGMDWKQACRYIAMNRHLIGMLDPIRKFLPWRKGGGKIPSMKSYELNQKREVMENKWGFRENVEPTEMESLEIAAARVVEIGTRACFDLFIYRFGETIFHQSFICTNRRQCNNFCSQTSHGRLGWPRPSVTPTSQGGDRITIRVCG